jgi:hypothetical protein
MDDPRAGGAVMDRGEARRRAIALLTGVLDRQVVAAEGYARDGDRVAAEALALLARMQKVLQRAAAKGAG